MFDYTPHTFNSVDDFIRLRFDPKFECLSEKQRRFDEYKRKNGRYPNGGVLINTSNGEFFKLLPKYYPNIEWSKPTSSEELQTLREKYKNEFSNHFLLVKVLEKQKMSWDQKLEIYQRYVEIKNQ
ncbi:hypothetical protein N9315_02665 [Alphaproteobacteria bacterium]|nr:hypothetical protein [Alphaproteobacteria bacterium]